MNEIGHYSLFIAHALAVWGVVAALYAFFKKDKRFLDSAIRCLYGITTCVIIAAVILIIAFLRDDFSLKAVAEYSRTTQPMIYKITALWGGMDGSLLFWEMLLSIFSTIAVAASRRVNERILPFTTFLLLLTSGFFLFLLTFMTSPFSKLIDPETGQAFTPAEGQGLNPLLQNFYMAIHPPSLYFGFVGFTIPFAFIIGALAHRESHTIWMKTARSWAIFSWIMLGIGIILGGYWAYIELGWGGYWAWDPVENASFMPWILGTAFLHSFIIQERRGMFRLWNVMFIIFTFLLCIYGTYLTRSGVLQSVHAFASDDPTKPWWLQLGNIFLYFLALCLFVSLFTIIKNRDILKSKVQIESASSRETLFLYGNILFALFCFVVLFGVTSPIFYRIISGREVHHGPEYFNMRIIPIGLLILLTMGVAGIAPWKRGGWSAYKKQILIPLIVSLLISISIVVLFFSLSSPEIFSDMNKRLQVYVFIFVVIFFSAFVLALITQEYLRAIRYARKSLFKSFLNSLYAPFLLNNRRYGGYLVHLGVVLIYIGIAFSSGFQKQYQQNLHEGESARFGSYVIRLAHFGSDDLNQDLQKVNELRVWSDLEVFKNDRLIAGLRPMRVFYAANPEQPSYEVALHSSPIGDIYTILAGFDLSEKGAIIAAYINPLVGWIWIGAMIVILGGIICLIPAKKAA